MRNGCGRASRIGQRYPRAAVERHVPNRRVERTMEGEEVGIPAGALVAQVARGTAHRQPGGSFHRVGPMNYGRVVDEEMQIAHVRALIFTVPGEPVQGALNEHRGTPVSGSKGAAEHEDFDSSALASATTFAGLWLADSCAQFFDVLDSILSAQGGRRVGYRPTIRAIIEHSAMSAWLMDPRAGASQRAARALLCEAVSADQLGEAMKHAGGQALVVAKAEPRPKAARRGSDSLDAMRRL